MLDDAPAPGPKRFRPPNIDLARARHKGPTIHVADADDDTDASSPQLLQLSDDDDDDFQDTLQLSDTDSSDSSSPNRRSHNGPSLHKITPTDEEPLPDDITKDLAELQQLRQSVKANLRLRPIRSRSNLPKIDLDIDTVISKLPFPPPGTTSTSSKPNGNGITAALGAISPQSTTSNYFTPIETPYTSLFSAFNGKHRSTPASPLPGNTARPISPKALRQRLVSSKRPLLIDTRPLAVYQASHLRHSIHIIRSRKPMGGLQSLDDLRKVQWDLLMAPAGPWDGNAVIYDNEMDLKDRDNLNVYAWAILPVLSPLLTHGGLMSAGQSTELQTLIITGSEVELGASRKGSGLSQLDTQTALRFKKLPEIEPSSSTSSSPPTPPLPRSPMPMMPSTTSSSRPAPLKLSPQHHLSVDDSSPSPPPSSIGFRRPVPPRRPSVPRLKGLDTRSAERLNPTSQNSPCELGQCVQRHLARPHSPSMSGRRNLLLIYTDDAFPMFAVSTILPNFLFLGPELTNPEHVEKLRALGIKRILNIAAECDDDHGLGLKEVFKYYKIPMRDTVEEENITRGVREARRRLHSAPTYVHCKAGKSRSVTAVMAYLIHANHWTFHKHTPLHLSNIGFVSELMNFEEQELGGKSVGVQAPNSAASNAALSSSHSSHSTLPSGAEAYTMASGGRRGATHVRESLPPVGTEGITHGGPLSAGTIKERVLGDSGQEMEIKDASGRYRHARRAPVDETTLQPMRRVSKAGLESSAYA
ncbi:hypothetical protein BJ912DRAFT_1023324 [Pholiota molesta]|nr:hypothetical protein BJ912DRAFT_1023324 [Pholiota molesta]